MALKTSFKTIWFMSSALLQFGCYRKPHIPESMLHPFYSGGHMQSEQDNILAQAQQHIAMQVILIVSCVIIMFANQYPFNWALLLYTGM